MKTETENRGGSSKTKESRLRKEGSSGTKESQLHSLIDVATTSPSDSLDVGLLTSIKYHVRASDDNVRLAHDLLLAKLKKKHSQVRYLVVLLMDELFMRSKLFRTLLVNNFDTFMVFSVGYHVSNPLPPPVNRATALRAKSMEVLEKWNDNFGLHYKPLRLGYEYLRDTLHLQFPNLRQAAAQAEQQKKERELRSQALVLEKYERLKHDFPALSSDIEQTLKQLEECFEILEAEDNGRDASAKESDVKDDDDAEDYEVNSLRRALSQAASKAPVMLETQDNKPIFDTMRDLCKLICHQHSSAIDDWMLVLIRVDTQDRDSRDFLFKRVIDIRNCLSQAKRKCLNLGINIQEHNKDDQEDEIIWEEGGIDNGEASATELAQEAETRKAAVTSIKKDDDLLITQIENLPAATSEFTSGEKSNRSQLLQEAPVLPWGPYLDRWGAEHIVPLNQRGLLLESHWGRVDYDALVPADKVVELNMRASYYTPVKEEIPPCLAPLKNGGLCQRRDLRVCPLHGPIKQRDSNGNVLSSSPDDKALMDGPRKEESSYAGSSTAAVTDMEFVKDIAAKAVANVRAQDATESNKKREKKLLAKRNREHNAAVLREAALANTVQGLGEAIGEELEKYAEPNVGSMRQTKKARKSLRAMLQPKPTAKDRLAERLLNSRANEATVHVLTRDEDAAYREAFANQW
ncbi:hypothetical protein KP509_11G021700 [Ceratopteris richardii]|uniref:UV-stimulated scaffold protein A C-terminal domain-containing protein n=1 Tax=Ceratopteris richardii TaxID=49495 RepID=A0A8T2TMZ0_CERRI|nr:hypothetical protein KP509_11G021700 [Ceratopteris richardii]